MVLPWQKHKREAAELHEKLVAESREVDRARAQTVQAVVEQVNSRATSSLVMNQIRLNGWTEMLQDAWKGRA